MFVAALLGSPTCRAVISAIATSRITPLCSHQLLTDLRNVLNRPKFKPYLPSAEIEELFRLLASRAIIVTPRHVVQASRDPDDNHLLSLALEGAEAILSGDKDVTSLRSFGRVPIFTPREFLGWLERHRLSQRTT